MARITVPYTSFEEGRFPPVCCKTGTNADRYTRWTFRQSPSWTWILLPFGVLPFLVARWFTTREFTGVLPITDRAARSVRRWSLLALLCGLAGIAVFFGAFVDIGSETVGIALLIAAGVLLIVSLVQAPSAHRDADRGTVELRNVHPAFVAAVQASWAPPTPPATPTDVIDTPPA